MKIFPKHIYIIGNRPQTDWRRVFMLAIVLAVVVSIYGFVFYHRIASQSVAAETAAPVSTPAAASKAESKPVDKAKLELNQIIELYLQKKALYLKMLSGLKNS